MGRRQMPKQERAPVRLMSGATWGRPEDRPWATWICQSRWWSLAFVGMKTRQRSINASSSPQFSATVSLGSSRITSAGSALPAASETRASGQQNETDACRTHNIGIKLEVPLAPLYLLAGDTASHASTARMIFGARSIVRESLGSPKRPAA